MKIKQSKTEVEKEVNEFFEDIKNKTPKEIKKIKRRAMAKNIALKERKKLFCEKCLNPYSGREKVRINKKIKSVSCNNCEKISRWKL